MALGNLMKWRAFAETEGEREKKNEELKEKEMERLVSQIWGEKEGGQDKFGGKVSGPVGVSSGVQPLWLGKEEEEGGGGRGKQGTTWVSNSMEYV